MSPAPITRDWIATHAGTVLHMHLNAGDRHILTRNVVDRRDGRDCQKFRVRAGG